MTNEEPKAISAIEVICRGITKTNEFALSKNEAVNPAILFYDNGDRNIYCPNVLMDSKSSKAVCNIKGEEYHSPTCRYDRTI